MSITSVKSGATGISLALDNNFMEPIATTLVGSGGVNQITFIDIPQTYKHLQLRFNAQSNRGTFGTDYNNITINNDTGSNYARHTLGGDGSTTLVGATANGSYVSGGACGTSTGGTFGATIIDILDYANTSKNKTTRVFSGNDLNGSVGGYPGEIYLLSSLWMNTDAVTSIKIVPNSGTLYTQHSRFSLYGIKG